MKKMKKTISVCLSVVLASTLLTGCFEEKISCNDETVQSLVYDLTKESVLEQVLLSKIKAGVFANKNNSNSMDSMTKGMIQNGMMDGFYLAMIQTLKYEKNGELNPKYKEIKDKVESANFSMMDFLTSKKDKELNSVECSATTRYKMDSEIYSFNTTYTAQLTDDEESVYVQMTGFDVK